MFFSNENRQSIDEHLSRIETHWSRMFRPQDEVLRYYKAVYRYFMGIVRQPDKAQELTQRFAERFLRTDFQQHAKQDKGRFRDFLKRALRNMAIDIGRSEQAERERLLPFPANDVALGELTPTAQEDGDFDASCREEWLALAWKRLAAVEQKTGTPYCTVLRFKINHPDMHSAEMAAQLSTALGTTLSRDAVRKTLERARAQFADLLIEEVLQSLPAAEHDRLEDELIELQLLDYCKSALQRRRAAS